MSITDELREYADTLSEHARCGATIPSPFNPHSGAPIGPTRETEELYTIADRIDAEHQKALAEQFKSLTTDMELMTDEEMAEHGWYRVLDADKQPIRIGDELDSEHYEDGTVVGLQFFEVVNGAPRVLIAIRPHGWDTPTWRDPLIFHHHHEPTVEDVLREFAGTLASAENNWGSDVNDAIAEYAAKLQLKERE